MTKALKRSVLNFTVLVSALIGFANVAQATATDPLKYLPVQEGGRLKPLDTLARETLQLVYGSQSYRAQDGSKRPAIEIVMTWMLVPAYWDQQKIVEVNHKGLKKSLDLPDDTKFYSPAELFANKRLTLVMQELAGFRETKAKLTPYMQAAQRLEQQLGTYNFFKQGMAIRAVPPAAVAPAATPEGEALAKPPAAQPQTEPERWTPVAELQGDMKEKFSAIAKAFIHALPGSDSQNADDQAAKPSAEQLKEAETNLQVAVDAFKAAAKDVNPALYPSEKDIQIEVHYKSFHPFMWAWILYLLAAIVIGISWQTDRAGFMKAGWAFAILAFLLHNYGFGLRMYLTGRPPVSNMYESVIWVSWGVVVFSFIFEFTQKRKFILLAGSAIAVLCLIVGDLAPTILDQSLTPLEPVLRSNMWLTVHVLTITLSYSAFFLAWGLGNIGLFFVLRGEKPTSDRVRSFGQAIYRTIQIGTVLLAAGTILGGVWADYSWGRFWGWDPKETWAFIALLGYLALLHARLANLIQTFGTLAFSVIAFNLVIMAWYGVNFVLGAGLHSYGFGAGGVEYVGGFVALDLIYLAYVAYVKMERERLAKAPKADANGT